MLKCCDVEKNDSELRNLRRNLKFGLDFLCAECSFQSIQLWSNPLKYNINCFSKMSSTDTDFMLAWLVAQSKNVFSRLISSIEQTLKTGNQLINIKCWKNT